MSDLPVNIRQAVETDKAFIIDSWVNTLAYSAPTVFWVPKSITRSIYGKMISRLLSARPELFSVLVRDDDPDQIFGWVCKEAAIHFCYVKEEFRRAGLATMLVPGFGHKPIKCTHWTNVCEKLNGLEYYPSLFKELINEIT